MWCTLKIAAYSEKRVNSKNDRYCRILRTYMELDVRCCSKFEKYADNLPAFLRNRPQVFERHVIARFSQEQYTDPSFAFLPQVLSQ